MKKFLLLVLVFVSSWGMSIAQERAVTGKVTDGETGEGIPGANVVIKGTSSGTITDFNGEYKINVSDDATLVFSYVGYAPSEVLVGSRSVIDIALALDVTALEEIVVMGYGSQDKKEITSSVSSVEAKDFNKGNFTNPTQLLQGKVAGLSVTRPGGNPNQAATVRLRGISSFGASQSPLIVLDGVIGASLDAVDPNDIETFDVLKDASAAAIYGTRGAAGVILITTKKGSSKKGVSNVTINTFGSADMAANLIPILSPQEFVSRGGQDFGAQTDWRDEIMQTALNGTVNASITGGFQNTSYLASVNYRNNDGIIKGTNRETLNTRLNINQNALNDRLRMNINLSFTNTDATNVNGEAARYATIYNPTAPITEDTPGANNNFGGYFQRPLFDFFNPVAMINQQQFGNEIRAALYSYRAEFDITDKLTISTQLSQDKFTDLYSNSWSRQDFALGFGRSGQAQQGLFDRTTTIWNGTLRYEDKLGDDLNMTLLVGAETQIFNERSMNVSSTRFLFDQGPNNLGAGGLRFGNGTDMSSNASRAVLNSAFTRANFNFKNIMFLSASLRAETYSGFGADNQTGYFPAVSLGADLTQAFDMGPFSRFKPRVSFGIVGQLPPSPTLALGIFGNGNRIPLNPEDPVNSAFVGINQLSNPNPQLQWETTEEFTFGIDFGLLDGRISGQVDYYRRNINDLIFNTPVPVGAPNEFAPGNFYTANNIWANLGNLNSSGLEFLISFNNIDLGGVSWTPTFNFTHYKRTRISEIGLGSIRLPEIRQGVPGSPGQNNNPIIWNREGERIGDFYGPRFEGLTDGGEYILSGTTPDEFERLGSALPTGDFGFANSFVYGNWDLNFLLRGSWGHMIYNSFRGFYENADGASNTWNSVVTSNTSTSPLVTSTPTFSDLYLEKGDFIRMDNLQIGYNIPSNSKNLSSFRVYGGVQNLFTITNFTGVDPEVRWTDTEDPLNPNPLAPGIERRNTYFVPRIWTAGLTITFN